MRRTLIVLAACSLWAACHSSPIAAGKKCDDSEECAAGLLCDTTQTPHICTTKLANVPDLAGVKNADLAATKDDLAGRDLATHDLAVVEDLSAVAHDLAKPIDLAKHEDLAKREDL